MHVYRNNRKDLRTVIVLWVAWVLLAVSARAAVEGRYVRVELPERLKFGGQDLRYMNIHELEVYSGDQNVALEGTASQSSGRTEPGLAIDGRRPKRVGRLPTPWTHSDLEIDPWLEVDLGQAFKIDRIDLFGAPGFRGRNVGFLVTVLDIDRNVVWYRRFLSTSYAYTANPVPFDGRYIGKQIPQDSGKWYRVMGENETERTSAHIETVKVSSLPDARERMEAFNDRNSDAAVEALCRRMHAALVVDTPGLERFFQLFDGGAYRQALDAYRDYFFDKMANPETYGIPGEVTDLPINNSIVIDRFAVEAAMDNKRVMKDEKDKYTIGETGPPGAVRWVPEIPESGEPVPEEMLNVFRRRQSNGARFYYYDDLFIHYATTGEKEYLRKWMDYLDDWCMFGRADIHASPLDLIQASELVPSFHLPRYWLFRQVLAEHPEFANEMRSTTLARYLLSILAELPPYTIRARRAEVANWGTMGTRSIARLCILYSEFKLSSSHSREVMRLSMSNFLHQRTLDGENIEAWDKGHRNADWSMLEIFGMHPYLPRSVPEPDALQAQYSTDLKLTIHRNTLTHVSPGGYYRPRWLPVSYIRGTSRAMNSKEVASHLLSMVDSVGREYEKETFQNLLANEPEAGARAAAIIAKDTEKQPLRRSDLAPYAAQYYLRDNWTPGAEYFILHNFFDRSQASNIRAVGEKNMLSGEGSMRYDLMKEGRSLLSSEGIVIDKKPSNRWHDSVQTGGKTRYCAMAGRNVSPTRFHSSDRFDLAEAKRDDPYSRPPNVRPTDWYGIWERQPAIDNTQIEGVTAYRQVFHVRNAGIWIVSDRIENPHEKTFDYAQFWTYPALLPEEGYRENIERLARTGHRLIEEDPENNRIRTVNPGFANVSSYFFGHDFEMVQEIDRHGNYLKTADAKPQIEIIREADDKRPDFFRTLRKSGVRWNGAGNQALVTVFKTRPAAEDIKKAATLGEFKEIAVLKGKEGVTGFHAVTDDGLELWFQSGADEVNALDCGPVSARAGALMVVRDGNSITGMVLDAREMKVEGKGVKLQYADAEFEVGERKGFLGIELGWDMDFTPIHRAIDTVVISPVQNVFTDSVKVSFDIPTQDMSDIELRYTLDGSDPTLESTLYTGPFPLVEDTYVKVRPFRKGLKETPFNIPSEEAGKTVGAVFRKQSVRPAGDTNPDTPGLAVAYFEGPWPDLFSYIGMDGMLEAKSEGTAEALLDPGAVSKLRDTDKAYGIRYDGYVRVPETGVYSFHAPEHLYTTTMDAGYDLRVWIDGEEWFPSPTLHSENIWHIPLEEGPHRLRVTFVDYRWKTFKNEYWMTWQEEQMWQGIPVLEVSGPGIDKRPLPAEWLFLK